jgi:hypothetical protein
MARIYHNYTSVISSQIAMIAVPLLLQAVPLQYGSDMLWRILDEDFNAEDWRVRFAAVEKATLIFRLADQEFAYTKQTLPHIGYS